MGERTLLADSDDLLPNVDSRGRADAARLWTRRNALALTAGFLTAGALPARAAGA